MAVLPNDTLKLLEDVSHVSPPPGSVPTTSLPLTFFDVKFLISTVQPLCFYDFPFPTSYFMQNILPKLKTSLSLALHHFFPFAGNIVFPPPPQIPYILYKAGDSVSLFVAQSTADFSHLIGDHARHFQELQALVPKLPPPSMAPSNCKCSGFMQKPVMAIQVTVFPMVGISIGLAFYHAAADGRTLAHFMGSWASLMSQGDLTCLKNSLPNFSRDLIKDPLGLASSFMKDNWKPNELPSIPVDKFRVSYVIKRSQIEFLKDWITKKCMEQNGSEPLRMSTFVVTCAYVWVCLIKLQESRTRDLSSSGDSNALSHLMFAVDCRERLKLPPTYFGNCLVLLVATTKISELIGENGIFVAAEAIGREVLQLETGKLKEIETLSSSKAKEVLKMEPKHVIGVVSSPKFRGYKTDFGLGGPRKIELANIGSLKNSFQFSIADSNEEGGVEFGLGFAPEELDSFNVIYKGSLKLP